MFDATMNYRLAWNVRGFFAMNYLSASEFDDRLQAWIRDTPPPALHSQMNLLDSHDIDRMMTACRNNRERFKQAYAFLFAYPGAPTVFYGTETGLEGTFPEDGRRAMPWDDLDDELVAYFTRLMTLRKTTPVLRQGTVQTVIINDSTRVYGFVRRLGDDIVYAIFNASPEARTVRLTLAEGDPTSWRELLDDTPVNADDGALSVTLEPRGAAWFSGEFRRDDIDHVGMFIKEGG
jgi:glycosidase